ncbi:uncharacterized protein [Oryctolagus cuniculus]|uniref:uncharacterized protein n=1 Tax=Oryctolagus cuniculus TaxID=9986 RepID=UPI003879850F
MAARASAGPGWSQELHRGLPWGCRNLSVWASAGSWTGSGAAGTQSGAGTGRRRPRRRLSPLCHSAGRAAKHLKEAWGQAGPQPGPRGAAGAGAISAGGGRAAPPALPGDNRDRKGPSGTAHLGPQGSSFLFFLAPAAAKPRLPSAPTPTRVPLHPLLTAAAAARPPGLLSVPRSRAPPSLVHTLRELCGVAPRLCGLLRWPQGLSAPAPALCRPGVQTPPRLTPSDSSLFCHLPLDWRFSVLCRTPWGRLAPYRGRGYAGPCFSWRNSTVSSPVPPADGRRSALRLQALSSSHRSSELGAQ